MLIVSQSRQIAIIGFKFLFWVNWSSFSTNWKSNLSKYLVLMSSLYQDLNVIIITFSAEQASRQNSRKMQKSHLIISNCPFLFPGTSLYVIRMIGPIVLGQSKTIWNSLYQSSRGKRQWALSSSFEICQHRRVQQKLAQCLES